MVAWWKSSLCLGLPAKSRFFLLKWRWQIFFIYWMIESMWIHVMEMVQWIAFFKCIHCGLATRSEAAGLRTCNYSGCDRNACRVQNVHAKDVSLFEGTVSSPHLHPTAFSIGSLSLRQIREYTWSLWFLLDLKVTLNFLSSFLSFFRFFFSFI